MEASFPSKQKLRYLNTPDAVRLDFPEEPYQLRSPTALWNARPGPLPTWHSVLVSARPLPAIARFQFRNSVEDIPSQPILSGHLSVAPDPLSGPPGTKTMQGPQCVRAAPLPLRSGCPLLPPCGVTFPRRVPERRCGDLPPPGPTVPGRPRSSIRAGSLPRRDPPLPPSRGAESPALAPLRRSGRPGGAGSPATEGGSRGW